jgi:ACR3 family arsenite efflux pump ArsB
MLFIFVIFVLHGDSVRKDPTFVLKIAGPVVLFLVTLLALGHMIAKAIRMSRNEASAFQCGTTVKNTAIAIALAFSSFDAQVAVALVISGPLAQLPTMLTYLNWAKKRRAKQA